MKAISHSRTISKPAPSSRLALSPAALKARRKFLRFFPHGFADQKYDGWERHYKEAAHEQWAEQLGRETFAALLKSGQFGEIALRAVRIEARTNLLFSFEKMALRDALKQPAGAKAFAEGLYDFLYGSGTSQERFERWVGVVAALPRKQTRVLTWPLVTVFGFLADPQRHIFLKPKVTKLASVEYGFDFPYASRPNWATYTAMLHFADRVMREQADLQPRDLIDAQSFIWVLGSDEYLE